MPITITGVDEIQRVIEKMQKAIKPEIRLMGEMGRIMLAAIDSNFITEGRGAWKENAPSTREGLPGILQYKGKLRNSMQLKLGTNFAEVRPSNAVYRYAAVNHFGSKKRGIPARPFMLLYSDHQNSVFEKYLTPLDEAMK